MKFYIGIKDLAANAMIEVLKKEDNRRYVTFEEMEKYGTAVVRILNENHEGVILMMSRNDTNALFHDYSDYFNPHVDDMGVCDGISLKDGKNLKDLIYKFRGYLAVDVLKAFINDTAIQALGLN